MGFAGEATFAPLAGMDGVVAYVEDGGYSYRSSCNSVQGTRYCTIVETVLAKAACRFSSTRQVNAILRYKSWMEDASFIP